MIASGTTMGCGMWPFKPQAGVSELQDELETVKRDMRNLRLDWETTYEKIRTLMARLAKRAEKLDTAAELGTGEAQEPDSTSVASPTFSRLTPRQKAVQLQVMNRRAGLNGGK